MALRVLLADDHDVVRDGFRAVLERNGFEVVADAADGNEAVHLWGIHRPDLAVLDLSMPRLNGLDAAGRIIELSGARTLVVLLTMHAEEHQVVAALRTGVRGYIVKTQGTKELVRALRDVAAGGVYLSPSICGMIVGSFLSGKEVVTNPLSLREREVLQLIAEGRTTKEIATVLDVTVKSAESYRTRLMDKLDIHDTASLVRYAIRHKIIEP